MVEHNPEQLDLVFSALSDPTRRALLHSLTRGENTVTGIARPFDMSLAAVSKHVRVLEKAGLLTRRVEGRVHYLSLAAGQMRDVLDWLLFYKEFWEDSLEALAEILLDDEG